MCVFSEHFVFFAKTYEIWARVHWTQGDATVILVALWQQLYLCVYASGRVMYRLAEECVILYRELISNWVNWGLFYFHVGRRSFPIEFNSIRPYSRGFQSKRVYSGLFRERGTAWNRSTPVYSGSRPGLFQVYSRLILIELYCFLLAALCIPASTGSRPGLDRVYSGSIPELSWKLFWKCACQNWLK